MRAVSIRGRANDGVGKSYSLSGQCSCAESSPPHPHCAQAVRQEATSALCLPRLIRSASEPFLLCQLPTSKALAPLLLFGQAGESGSRGRSRSRVMRSVSPRRLEGINSEASRQEPAGRLWQGPWKQFRLGEKWRSSGLWVFPPPRNKCSFRQRPSGRALGTEAWDSGEPYRLFSRGERGRTEG